MDGILDERPGDGQGFGPSCAFSAPFERAFKALPGLRLYPELVEIGRKIAIFRALGRAGAGAKALSAILTKSDRKWLKKRLEKLGLMFGDGSPWSIPKSIWNVATLCMHPTEGWDAILEFLPMLPPDWRAAVQALAGVRPDGSMRDFSSLSARSMLTCGIILWLLSRPDPSGGPGFNGVWGRVIKGLPYGAFAELLATYEQLGDRLARRVPHVNTVWGTHRVGGRYDRGEVGYLAAFRQAGLIKTKQPPWHVVEPGRRGKMRTLDDGTTECWAFVEISLRIPATDCGASNAQSWAELPMSPPQQPPPPPLLRPPPPAPSLRPEMPPVRPSERVAGETWDDPNACTLEDFLREAEQNGEALPEWLFDVGKGAHKRPGARPRGPD